MCKGGWLVAACVLTVSGAVCLEGGAACNTGSFQVPSGARYPFAFGLGTSSYQVEGAVQEGGRGISVWDTFAHAPGKTRHGETGDLADDVYHRFRDDVELMKAAGLRNYRFSVAWPRILPNGTGQINWEGVKFYSDLVDALLAACITPLVTLFHWDTPQQLQDEYGGWASPRIVDDFADYAEVMFRALGDRVKHWTTLNEPHSFCQLGYGYGIHAPGIKSDSEVHWCAYHSSLAHAAAVERFRGIVPGAKIGLATPIHYYFPFDASSKEDEEAVMRANDWQYGIYIDPIYKGDLPQRVRQELPWLPVYNQRQKRMLAASRPDYFGFNYYTSKAISNRPSSPPGYYAVSVHLTTIQTSTWWWRG